MATVAEIGSIKKKRVFYLAFATLTLLVLGLIYAWSIFASPLGKQFPAYGPLLAQVFQVSMFAFCVSALFGAQIIKKMSFRVAIITAAILLAAGFILTAFGAGLGVWSLFVFYGIVAGSGCGIGYNAIISLVNAWFPDKVGFCSGVQMMGFGLASLVFGSLANLMFSIVAWQMVFLAIAIVGACLMVVFAVVVKPAPANINELLCAGGSTKLTLSNKVSPTQSQNILKTKVFWIYCIWAIFIIACGLTLIGSAKQGAESLGVNANIAALLVGLVSTMNGISRPINGAIFDRFGLIPVMLIQAAITALTMLALAISFSGSLPQLYFVAAIMIAFPYGSAPVMASAFARQRYGAEGFAKNLGVVNLTIAAGSMISIAIGLIVGSAGDGINDDTIYLVLAFLAVVAFASVFLFRRVYTEDLKKIDEELQ